MKIPGPDHPIKITPASGRVTVTLNGRQLATSTRALSLWEASYPPVYYFPREDVDLTLLAKTERHTYCPYKGDCSYYSITPDGERGANAVWSYESPYDAVASIKGYLAFYSNRVDAIKVS